MKRFGVLCIIFVLVLSVCGCTKTNLNTSADVTLTFIYGEENICIALEEEESKAVIDILNGNNYAPLSSGIPSCGFNKDISLNVEGRVFAIACDTCNCVQDLGNLRFFDIPAKDMAYIHSLFEKYGGYFPCV